MKFQTIILFVSIGLILLSFAPASQAQSISMSYVTVGNPGNSDDPATGNQYGNVSYTYDIGEYDVTDSQYCTFLNDVDPTGANTLALYLPQGDFNFGIILDSTGANGSKYSVIPGYAKMPVVDVDYWDTLRFVNWMNNGEGNASTETGAYTLLGGNTDGYGTPSNASSLMANPQHNAGATVWMPSENEWYKAAYYSPILWGTGGYWTYATQSNILPGNVVGSGSNEANYSYYGFTEPGPNFLTAVGSFTNSKSYYGTYDQVGDVLNWVSYNWVTTTGSPVLRGSDWFEVEDYQSSSNRKYDVPANVNNLIGFRVASVPEPSTWAMMAGGVGALVAFRRRRRS